MIRGKQVGVRRTRSNTKNPLKEKIVAIYEMIFQGKDPSVNQPRFWSELFLLKVNIPFLENCIAQVDPNELLKHQSLFNKLFEHCLSSLQDPSAIRKARSIETYSVLLNGLFKKAFKNLAIDVLAIISSLENAENYFVELFKATKNILDQPDIDLEILSGLVNLLAIMVTATDNLNQNILMEYVMQIDLFPSLAKILIHEQCSEELRYQAVMVLSILSYYRKYEQSNPYSDLFRHIDVEGVITSHRNTISNHIKKTHSIALPVPTGAVDSSFEKITSYLTFWMPQEKQISYAVPEIGMALLSLYDWAHCNALYREKLCSQDLFYTDHKDPSQVSELLQQVLTLCSHIFADVHTIYQACYSKLSLIIFLCLTEDINCCSFLHDPEVGCYLTVPGMMAPPSNTKRPVVCVILDLAVYLLRTNLKRKMQFGLYLRALNVIQRIICFEKGKTTPQMNYKWSQVWDVLFTVVRFISSVEMFKNPEIVQIATEITTIFNLFITYGDSFLPDSADYDELFYQMIHQSKTLLKFHNTAELLNVGGGLVLLQENIATIIRHFNSKVDLWQAENPSATLTQVSVTEIIRGNYGSLKLNLFDGLDRYERYIENPREIPFFTQFLRMVIFHTKATLSPRSIDLHVI